jgi:hypothetical protein
MVVALAVGILSAVCYLLSRKLRARPTTRADTSGARVIQLRPVPPPLEEPTFAFFMPLRLVRGDEAVRPRLLVGMAAGVAPRKRYSRRLLEQQTQVSVSAALSSLVRVVLVVGVWSAFVAAAVATTS